MPISRHQARGWPSDSGSVTGQPSLPDDQRFRPRQPECTHFGRVEGARSTGSSADGGARRRGRALRACRLRIALLPDRRAFRPNGLFVADGGSECCGGPCCAAGSASVAREAGCSSACRSRPRLSLGFPRVPFLFLWGVCWGAGVERSPPKRGIYAGQRPVALVRVTGFEPAAFSSRTSRNRNHVGH
jgi:hypothetical protein